MVAFRSLDEIILSMLDFARLVQPDLDTKPGSVARDITIDLPASEISKIYGQLRNISNLQSLATAVGIDLDRQARSFGIVRNTGAAASGVVVFTINSLVNDIFIPAGTTVLSRSKIAFRTRSDASFDSTKPNIYRSNALRVRSDLDLAGIKDTYALEVRAEATQFGSAGNIGKFSIISHSVPGISNVTNLESFSGGIGAEDDSAFRSRALGIFAGANIGTTLSYVNKIKTDPRVIDVLAVEPGDPLMTRDGSQIGTDSQGNKIVISIGTGGKVDFYIQGSAVELLSESFIFRDLSGKSDPTSPKNDFILGQRSVNPFLVFQQKRKLLIDQGTLPFQPVENIVSINGSLSGPNFVEKFTDANGQVKGSFELVKDTGAFAGSPFGFDKIHFISGQIDLDGEVTSKGGFNSQDPLDFTDVQQISAVTQDVLVVNEHSTVTSTDRSILTLTHTPIATTTRVQNLTTGERYRITNQNVDGGTTNTTGRIKISGSTLPTSTDILQVNYLWNYSFDDEIDFDSLVKETFTRTVQDSVDWGFANKVEEEEQDILYSVGDGYHVLTRLPISRVINVNTRLEETITRSSGKLVTSTEILNVFSVKDVDGREVFNTSAANGSFSGFEITLPTDTLLAEGAQAAVIYNVEDIYSPTGTDQGSFSGSVIKINATVAAGDTVFVDYVADVSVLLPTTALSELPALGDENNFIVSDEIVGNQPVQNIYESDSIVSNLKYAPSYLKMSLQGITATGRLIVKGISFTKIDTNITIKRDSLTVDLSDAIREALQVTSIPSTVYVAKVSTFERVTLSGGMVSSVDFEFDLTNISLKTVDYANATALPRSSLTATEITLSGTDANTEEIPTTGEIMHVAFYVVNTSEVENITVSASGTVFSANKYVWVEKIAVTSGFVGLAGSTDGTLLIESATQPGSGSTYNVSYSYTAPKEGERLVVNYNYNRLITDSTFAVENIRPVTADLLIKAAKTISIDVSVSVIPVESFTQNKQVFIQNVQQAISTFLTSGGLNATVDASDIINAVYGISGVDRVDLLAFNETGLGGLVRSIEAGRDEYLIVGTIDVAVGVR